MRCQLDSFFIFGCAVTLYYIPLTAFYILRSCQGTMAAELFKPPRSYTPGGGLRTDAQAAESGLSSRKIEKGLFGHENVLTRLNVYAILTITRRFEL